MFSSLSTRIRNSLQQPIKEKIFFLHIPKCGGTSVKNALRNKYISLDPRRDSTFAALDRNAMVNTTQALGEEESAEFSVAPDCILRMREHVLLYHMGVSRIKCITGHVPFSEIAFRKYGNQFAFITILRDPVERWISEYYFNKSLSFATSDMDITQYMDSSFGQAQGTQYVLFLGGRSNGNDHFSKKAVQRALENLNRCTLVGFLENLDSFNEQFQSRFGTTLDIGKKNITTKNTDRQQISSSIRQRIETICERDLEIYHHASQLTS